MKLTLIRTQFEAEATFGHLMYKELMVARTQELPTLWRSNWQPESSLEDGEEKEEPDVDTALLPGLYRLELKSNPLTGTPFIRIKGKGCPLNTTIRVFTPILRHNKSVVLCHPEAEGEYGKMEDYESWCWLVRMIHLCQENKEKVLLVIKEVRPKRLAILVR